MRILSTLLFLIALVSAAFAAYLYWEQTFGSCRDGCPEGMVFIFFLPAVAIALVSLVLASIFKKLSNRPA